MDTLNQTNVNSLNNTQILNESTILYLEDDDVIRNETKSIFEKFFQNVLVAKDGQEGLSLYSKHKEKINIILTDINMPNLDGIGFMTEIRKTDYDIPILIVTAFNDVDILARAIKLNVADYIVKPMQINSTIKILNKILTDRFNKKLVEKQQHELVIYKDILDKENLVSETDLKGYITYANDIFCEISGYSRDELIGANHNIVRHPDVSPKVYENMWKTIQDKKTWIDEVEAIIIPEATCSAMINQDWEHYLHNQPEWKERASKIAKKVFMATKWLENNTDLKELLASSEKTINTNITYHDPCHAKKMQGVWKEPRELLKQNYVLTEMSDSNRCCGFGGVTMQTEKYHLAKAAGAPKAAMIRDTNAQIVSAECSACRMQISNSLYQSKVDVEFKNPIELIADALED
jgi:CheY-like chemotaxis protein